MNSRPSDEPPPVSIPVTGELDLHTFLPRDLPELLPEYLLECRRLDIREVRIIHGKGTGTLREGVHRLLEKMAADSGSGSHSSLSSTWPAPAESGGWGATMVRLL